MTTQSPPDVINISILLSLPDPLPICAARTAIQYWGVATHHRVQAFMLAALKD